MLCVVRFSAINTENCAVIYVADVHHIMLFSDVVVAYKLYQNFSNDPYLLLSSDYLFCQQ